MVQEILLTSQNEPKVKEYEYELTIGDTRAANLITELINGYLDSLIIDTSAPINIAISYEKYPDISIFRTKTLSFSGQKMFIPRALATSNDDENFNYSQEKYCLNDRLRIEVEGVIGTIVKVCIRL